MSILLVFSWGWSFSQGDGWQYLEMYLVAADWGWGAAAIQWVETRAAAQHPAVHRTAPPRKAFSIQG